MFLATPAQVRSLPACCLRLQQKLRWHFDESFPLARFLRPPVHNLLESGTVHIFQLRQPCRLVSLNTLRLINTRPGCIVSPASPRLSSTKTRPHACASFEKQTLFLDLRLDAQIQTLVQVRFDAPYRPARGSLPAPPSEPPFCAS